ncbi:hypothetical protein DMA11_11920 [Marinilabiliaceae bacterium JC017]|nr:hypothetical protein DMA11_11920 [Marinilabiliaceae bacterium JC017]
MESASVTDWISAVGSLISAVGIFIVAWLGYRWSFKSWQKQQEENRRLQREEMQSQSRTNALLATWSLMAYLTHEENDRTIFVHRTDEAGNRKLCFRRQQAKEFCNQLCGIHYHQGHGVFMSNEVRDLLFGMKRNLHKLLDAERNNPNDTIPLKNGRKLKEKNQVFDELSRLLKAKVKACAA